MAWSGPWIPADLVPRVTVPRILVVGLKGHTISVPPANLAPANLAPASQWPSGLTRWACSECLRHQRSQASSAMTASSEIMHLHPDPADRRIERPTALNFAPPHQANRRGP